LHDAVAIIATEPKTVFPVIPSHDNLMCSMPAKLPVFWEPFERKNAGKCDRIGGPRIRSFAKSPQKGPHQTVAALERHRTSVDTETRFFGRISRYF
jgi:hypothetical protein